MPLLRMKNEVSTGWQMRYLLICLIILGLTLTGCKFAVSPFSPGMARLEKAEQAFFKGDYPGAREEFTLMLEMATHPDTRTTAQYGIACVDMMTVKTSDEFLTAMDSFLQTSTGDNRCRDMNPQLLIMAVSHGTALMKAEQDKEQKQLLSRVAALSATEKKYKKERLKMQHLIKTLQHQISALESIDQERQEKRKTQ